jgi:peptidylprolyl isomerase
VPRPLPLFVAALTLVFVAACSSSSHSSSSPTSSAAAAGSSASGSAPAVANAADLHSAPTVSAGTGTPPTTLVIKDLVRGTGLTAQSGSTVNVQYVGANYATGKVFDSSWQRGQPATFSLSQVIPGFSQGIVGMQVGGRRELVIPPAMGYGPSGSGPVGPNETLVFVVDLVGVQ